MCSAHTLTRLSCASLMKCCSSLTAGVRAWGNSYANRRRCMQVNVLIGWCRTTRSDELDKECSAMTHSWIKPTISIIFVLRLYGRHMGSLSLALTIHHSPLFPRSWTTDSSTPIRSSHLAQGSMRRSDPPARRYTHCRMVTRIGRTAREANTLSAAALPSARVSRSSDL